MTATGATTEWRRHYMLPIAAALGYATSVIPIYGLGPYIGPISETFGWSRTQTTFGPTIRDLAQRRGHPFRSLARPGLRRDPLRRLGGGGGLSAAGQLADQDARLANGGG